MQNSRIRDCWTDVSRLRSYRCTIIASITSDGIRGEGGWMRLRGLTGDIRGWVERADPARGLSTKIVRAIPIDTSGGEMMGIARNRRLGKKLQHRGRAPPIL